MELRLLSWNVHDLFLGLSKDRQQRLGAIGQVIRDEAPDVVLLQELWIPADAEALVQAASAPARGRCPGHRYIPVDNVGRILGLDPALPIAGQLGLPYSLMKRWRKSGLMTLVRADGDWRFPEDYQVPEDADFREYRHEASDLKFWQQDGHGDKGVQRVRIQHRSGQHLVLYNTHLQSEYDDPLGYAEIRRGQIDELTRFAEVTSDGHPVVCAGDFNTAATDEVGDRGWYDHETFHHLVRTCGWRELTAQRRADCERNAEWWRCNTHISAPDEAAHWIDYLLTREHAQWQVKAPEIEVLANARADHPWSDHHGLLARIEIAPRRARSAVPLAALAAAGALRGPTTRRDCLLGAGALLASLALRWPIGTDEG